MLLFPAVRAYIMIRGCGRLQGRERGESVKDSDRGDATKMKDTESMISLN